MSARPICRDTDLRDTRPLAGRFKVEVAGAQDAAPQLSRYSSLLSSSTSAPNPMLPQQIPSRRHSHPVVAITRRQLRHEFRLARISSRKERAISSERGVLRWMPRRAQEPTLLSAERRSTDDDLGPPRESAPSPGDDLLARATN